MKLFEYSLAIRQKLLQFVRQSFTPINNTKYFNILHHHSCVKSFYTFEVFSSNISVTHHLNRAHNIDRLRNYPGY